MISEIYFKSFLNKGYISKVALSKRLDEEPPPACVFTGEGYWLSVGWLREGEHEPVNAYHTGWNVKLSVVQWLSFSRTDPSGVLIIQRMRARYLQEEKKSTANYLLLKRWDTCCYGFFVFSTRLDIRFGFIMFSKWCTFSWECLLCAVTCCRILCMKSVKASKHVTGILVFKGYVVVFQTTPPFFFFFSAESAFPWAHCWLWAADSAVEMS